MKVKKCDHGNTMGLHGQVICVWCNAVVRQMTPQERAVDSTFRDVQLPEFARFMRMIKSAAK